MQDQHALQSGSILDRYRIILVLGEGGFGITYLAEDIQLGLKVVIKEYFPNEFAMRSGNSTITAKSKSIGDFSKGMQRFKEEAQTLAKFNHPSIVKILGYFEANDTAYFVMEYEEGIDLSQYLKQEKRALTQEEILSIMMPILEGLKEVHKCNYLHRDIKPGNILLRSNKSPVLIDFGASKLALGEASKSITSMLTEGYAPLEQYSTDIKQQGAFTDLYAVAAVIYKMITREVPPSAQTRSYALLSGGNDPYKSLATLKALKYDDNFLKAIDRALDINANKRPQSVHEFQKDIAGQLENKAPNIPKHKKTPKLPILLVLFLLLIGGAYYFYSLDDKGSKVNNNIPVVEIDKHKVEEEKKHIEAKRLEQEVGDAKSRKEKEEQIQKAKLESERFKTEREKQEKNKSPKKMYESSCAICHATDAMGAPVVGNKKEWKNVLRKGINKVYSNAINGKSGMPPKGGAMNLTTRNIKDIIDYMVSQSQREKQTNVDLDEKVDSKTDSMPRNNFQDILKKEVYYIQVGMFTRMPSSRFLSIIKNEGFNYTITENTLHKRSRKKLLIGPYIIRSDADQALVHVRNKISTNAFIIKQK